jgi:NAD(P)-dependent dehydrogenase (short-subunit alcohol dehydrogenase family)
MPIDALRDRHILVLGGSAGIGLATAEYLLRSGAIVTICGRTPERLAQARSTLLTATGAPPDNLVALPADARDADAVRVATERSADAAGEVDGVFVVAGDATYLAMADNTVETVQKEFVDNMYPLVNAIAHAVPRMRRKGGSIVAVSSVAAVLSSTGIGGYGAAKAALEQYVRFAADELGPLGIRVNAVRPGLTKTAEAGQHLDERYAAHFRAITPLGAHGLPEDFAGIVSLLLSGESRWITGQCISVDGGFGLRGHGGGAGTVMSTHAVG